ncbi:MAG: hypothetical protein P8I55_10770 [Crocinitomix sp.]|nr:hypothetical protein [Crocinitomix sp.]
MVHFPATIDAVNKRITTISAAGCCVVGYRTFEYNAEKNSWRLSDT